jgi:hypothetical protein
MAAMMNSGIIVGQQRSNGQVSVLTVCEVLDNVTRYGDSAVAVVGRLERRVSLIDHYEFLSQDRCEHPLITHGHVWSDKIQIWAEWEAGMPKPPSDRPKLERSVVASKLSIARKTSKFTDTAAAPNQWAIVYGRIARVPNLNEDCGEAGCGGDNVPLVIIAEPYNVHRLGKETPLPHGK